MIFNFSGMKNELTLERKQLHQITVEKWCIDKDTEISHLVKMHQLLGGKFQF